VDRNTHRGFREIEESESESESSDAKLKSDKKGKRKPADLESDRRVKEAKQKRREEKKQKREQKSTADEVEDGINAEIAEAYLLIKKHENEEKEKREKKNKAAYERKKTAEEELERKAKMKKAADEELERKAKMKKAADEKYEKGKKSQPAADTDVPTKEKVIKVRRYAPREKYVESSDSDSDSSDDSSFEEFKKKKKAHTTPAKSKPVKRKEENPVVPTGEIYDPPCSACRMGERVCEKHALGSACLACRKSKQRCEYSQPKRKRGQSKAEVASADEHSENETDDQGPRRAAKVASKAITKNIEDIEASIGTSKKKTPGKTKGIYPFFFFFFLRTSPIP